MTASLLASGTSVPDVFEHVLAQYLTMTSWAFWGTTHDHNYLYIYIYTYVYIDYIYISGESLITYRLSLITFGIFLIPKDPDFWSARYKVCRRQPWKMPICAEEALRKCLAARDGEGEDADVSSYHWYCYDIYIYVI